jgi:hypothetical protein
MYSIPNQKLITDKHVINNNIQKNNFDYLENYTNYIDKISSCVSICLLGSGNSLSKYLIDFNKYDIVIGTNRIHNTDLLQHVDVLYHNASIFDNNMQKLNHAKAIISQLDYIIFVPAEPNSYINKYKTIHDFLLTEHQDRFIVDFNMQQNYIDFYRTRLLTGVCALVSTIQFTESKFDKLDIYGFDFYAEGYYGGLNSYGNGAHNITQNIEIFKFLIDKDNINYFI